MARPGAREAFEEGVESALEFFKQLDWDDLRRQVAESADRVREALEDREDEQRTDSLSGRRCTR